VQDQDRIREEAVDHCATDTGRFSPLQPR
jgi:hypothetical protein